MAHGRTNPAWTWAAPSAGASILASGLLLPNVAMLQIAMAVALVATVFAAVHHAEVVAHRIGEPFGTLVLAIAVTVIEVALIVSMMVSAPEAKAGLARDTVFAAVMIVCNGIVGVSLLLGGMRHRVQNFQLEGASAALAVLAALTVLSLVVPNVTTSASGPTFSSHQLAFVGLASLLLYGAFVFVQTVRHRDYFLPAFLGDEDAHAEPPSAIDAWTSFLLLLVSLVTVVGLAKLLTPAIEAAVAAANAPKSFVGIAIAGVVLLPEALAAVNAARSNRLQTSLNLALGSALATIGLTVPAVAFLSLALGYPLQLGLGPLEQVMLALTLFLGVITLGTGRTTVLQGIVHLVLFGAFLFFALVP